MKLPGKLYALAPGVLFTVVGAIAAALINTTPDDFLQPGTQPGTLNVGIQETVNCSFCHGMYDPNQEPFTRWQHSMMAQAARDPIFWACVSIANQDAANSGEMCIRCHAPGGWLEGRSTPTDGSALITKDFEGVNCNFCHRLVDPVYDPNHNPVEDQAILAFSVVNQNPHTGQYVVDPNDRRRGPFDLGPSFFFHEWRQSPFHQESLMCANCHDVSNPAYTRDPNTNAYVLNDLNQPHPTHNKFDEFPIERTYSEWAMSSFAQAPIEMGGRFGGNKTAVSSCQDCHMPDTTGTACVPELGGAVRNDLPLHNFNGANSWVLRAVDSLYPSTETGLFAAGIESAIARNIDMLQRASDMELNQAWADIDIRIINQTGHKLPTGYHEGRRMWLNIRFLDDANNIVREYGAYDPNSAVLTQDTKIYQAKHGLDADVATLTGLPVGESFHFVLNNVVLFDNRIPPRGFTNANFEAVQAEPVAYIYADGQYWDDTTITIPVGATRVEARLYHQTTTKEYIEFLRDTNTTDTRGQTAYDQWVLHGKSAPVEMDMMSLALDNPGDLDGDGHVTLSDLAGLLANFGGGPGGDVNGDGFTDLADLALLLAWFGT